MNTKFVISQVTLLLLVLSIYSVSSTHYVSAARSYTTCGPNNPISDDVYTVECCDIEENDEGNITSAKCYKLVCKGGTCVEAEKSVPKINPEDLNILEENITKGPRTDLPLGGLLEEDISNDTKAPKIPEDFGGLQDEEEDDGPTINPEVP
jgi:hypothetical protein